MSNRLFFLTFFFFILVHCYFGFWLSITMPRGPLDVKKTKFLYFSWYLILQKKKKKLASIDWKIMNLHGPKLTSPKQFFLFKYSKRAILFFCLKILSNFFYPFSLKTIFFLLQNFIFFIHQSMILRDKRESQL